MNDTAYASGPGERLRIPDAHLRTAILQNLGMPEDAEVTRDDAERLQTLNANDQQIESIEGLQYFTGLWNLDLSGTQVTDLGPVVGLEKLTSLVLSDTPVVDIAPLANLAELESLDLRGTNVADLSPLRGLENLVELNLTGTRVADIRPLAGLFQLEVLDLSDTQVTDLSPVEGLENLSDFTRPPEKDVAAQQRKRAITLINKGTSWEKEKRFGEAAEAYGEAIDILRGLKVDPPKENSIPRTSLMTLLGLVLSGRGHALAMQDRWGEAEAACREAVEVRRALSAEDPAHLADLGESLLHLGFSLLGQDRWGEAEAAYWEAVEVRHALSADPAHLAGLGESHLRLGEILAIQEYWETAAEVLQQSIEIYQQLVESDSQSYSEPLSYAQDLFRKVQVRLKVRANLEVEAKIQALLEEPRTIAAVEEAVNLARMRTGVEAASYAKVLAHALKVLAQTLSEMEGQESRAATHISEAVDILRRVKSPDAEMFKEFGDALIVSGAIAEKQGDLTEAGDRYLEAVDAYRMSRSGYGILSGYPIALVGLARVFASREDWKAAKSVTKEALDILGGMKDPTPEILKEFGDALIVSGAIAENQNDLKEAGSSYRRAADKYRAASNRYTLLPGYPVALVGSARVFASRGSWKAAKLVTKEALDIWRPVDTWMPGVQSKPEVLGKDYRDALRIHEEANRHLK